MKKKWTGTIVTIYPSEGQTQELVHSPMEYCINMSTIVRNKKIMNTTEYLGFDISDSQAK